MTADSKKDGRRASPKSSLDLHALGARVVSVYGPFNSRVLIDMPADKAADLFPDGFGTAPRRVLMDAVMRDLEALHRRDPDLAESALALSALAMALEIEHPFNSATSKSMCQARLTDTLRELRELAPPEEKKDALSSIEDEIGRRRERKRVAGAADPAGS